jgi:two-component system, chemotaxis family, CheB/CheR fusion protein
VVAIGASAGGLEAYKDFFHALPVDTGMAFVLIQHLDPTHHSLLAEILSKATQMPVEEVKSGTRLKANRVYVIPPGAFMAINAGAFTLTPRTKGSAPHLSVNFFMRSLAEECKSGAIGAILANTDRGRDTYCYAPPAQNRTCGFPASGSHLGCVTSRPQSARPFRM